MSRDKNDNATCCNSPPQQQEENFMWDNPDFLLTSATEEGNATTSGTDGNATTSATKAGNATTDGNTTTAGTKGKKQKQRRQRRLNELSDKTETIDEISLANGEPVKPEEVAANYGGQCIRIVRLLVSINEKEIRKNADICTRLLEKLHERYNFPKKYKDLDLKNNLVKRKALGKFSKDLSSWKTRVRRLRDAKNLLRGPREISDDHGRRVGNIQEELRYKGGQKAAEVGKEDARPEHRYPHSRKPWLRMQEEEVGYRGR